MTKNFDSLKRAPCPKLRGNAADHVTRFVLRDVHDPCQQRRCRCFPVCAGNNEVVSSAQKIIFQDFREREIEQFSVQDRFCFRVAALDCITDHHHIGFRWNIFRTITGE